MKNVYVSPLAEMIFVSVEDILTVSDNDAPFLPPIDGGMDDGWSGYH